MTVLEVARKLADLARMNSDILDLLQTVLSAYDGMVGTLREIAPDTDWLAGCPDVAALTANIDQWQAQVRDVVAQVEAATQAAE
jgi:hypothetical protein